MSLSTQAIERLFARLNATYGKSFMAQYEGVDTLAVKSSWAHELSGFSGRLEMLAWALENLPERAPNVVQFRNLARQSPAPTIVALPAAKTDPERVQAELGRLNEIRSTPPVDWLAWAKRIVDRFDSGEIVSTAALTMAKTALNRSTAA